MGTKLMNQYERDVYYGITPDTGERDEDDDNQGDEEDEEDQTIWDEGEVTPC